MTKRLAPTRPVLRPLLLAGVLSLGLGILPGGPALAQDSATALDLKPIDMYPKPWPVAHLITAGTLTIGTTGTAPPRTTIDPATHELAGSYVQLFKKIAADLGLKPAFVRLDWAGILPGLGANRFDLACDGASWTPERLGSTQFLMTTPTAVTASVALARADSGITTWDQVAGRPIGGVRGENYFEDVKKRLPNSPATAFPGEQEAMLGLANGQVQLVALNLSTALHILATTPDKGAFKLVGPALQVFPQGLCVNPREPDLLVAVNTLLGKYRQDGTLKKLIEASGDSTAEVDLLTRIGY
jgi:ABC-type amino acid transport substrate-binding protein